MAVSFKSDPTAVGFFAPMRFEADVFDCEVEGRIPADLDGAFYVIDKAGRVKMDGSPWNAARARTLLRRWTFDLSSKRDTWDEETLFPQIAGSLPRIDDRHIALPYRYAFNGYADPSRPFDEKRGGNLKGRVTNCYARMDLQTGKVDSYFAGDTHALAEVQFVPRKKGAAEGDGYLIGVAANHAEMCSELVIADAQRLADGDVARVKLPFRAHQQVHGWWVPADELPLTPPV